MSPLVEERLKKAKDIYGRVECSTCHNPYMPADIRWRPFKNGTNGRFVCKSCAAKSPDRLPSRFSVCR